MNELNWEKMLIPKRFLGGRYSNNKIKIYFPEDSIYKNCFTSISLKLVRNSSIIFRDCTFTFRLVSKNTKKYGNPPKSKLEGKELREIFKPFEKEALQEEEKYKEERLKKLAEEAEKSYNYDVECMNIKGYIAFVEYPKWCLDRIIQIVSALMWIDEKMTWAYEDIPKFSKESEFKTLERKQVKARNFNILNKFSANLYIFREKKITLIKLNETAYKNRADVIDDFSIKDLKNSINNLISEKVEELISDTENSFCKDKKEYIKKYVDKRK